MSTSRRDILQQIALGTLGLSALPSVASATRDEPLTVAGGSAALDELRATPVAAPFDTSWTAKLTGKYRAVFDVPEIESGTGVWRAGLWSMHYTDVMQATPADLNPVIVIRHSAIPLVMSQEFWAEYGVGKASKVTHPMTEKKTARNPVLMTVEADGLAPMLGKLTLDRLQANGAIVLACNMAFGRMLGMVMQQDKSTPQAAREKAMGMMLPGVILQPNGIFGITLAQQNGCVFVNAV
jgi:hypothetical protein